MTLTSTEDSPVPGLQPVTTGDRAARYRSRRGWIVGVAVVMAVIVGVGLVAASMIKSPAQQAANAAPPPADVLTAAVQSRVLTQVVVTRGTVAASSTITVSAPGTGADAIARTVVTRQPLPVGAAVRAGALLVEVSGRPVIALPGQVPMYRDLGPGSEGGDVAELQSALSGLGFGRGNDRLGTYGSGTKSAIVAFYASLGYTPLPAQADGDIQIATARHAALQAQWAVQDAAPGRDKERAQIELGYAQQALAATITDNGPMVPVGEIQFIPRMPARVASVQAHLGATVAGPIMTLSTGTLTVTTFLQDDQQSLVRAGMSAQITDDSTGRTYPAVVASVAAAASTTDSQSDQSSNNTNGYRTIIKPRAALPNSLDGMDVRVTVVAASSGGKVLVVPSSAISAGADYQTAVTVVSASGTQQRVQVSVGATGDGYVQITPTAAGTITAGQQVMIGAAGPSS